MKLELVKETRSNGEVVYFTNKDNHYVDSSLSLKYDKAKLIYDNIVKNEGKYIELEVLESVEIKID